jgi:hypothetical protein
MDKNNKKHNPINNPTFAQRRKDENDLENRKIIEAQGLGQHVRSESEADELCEDLLTAETYAILGDQAMCQAIEKRNE